MKKLLHIFVVHISVTSFSQNVGIGITNPATPLHVRLNGSAGGVLPFLSTATFESNSNTLVSLLSPDANNSAIVFGLNSNNISGSIVYNNPATLKGFQFRTKSNILQMVLDSSGNVGIGTGVSIPAAKLEVKNTLRSTVKISSNSTIDTSELVLSNKHSSGIFTDFSIKNIREQGLFFSSNSDLSANTATNTLVLTPGGNVGVGIVPTSKLDIDGTVKLEGTNLFEFGAGVAGKEVNAGKIGYNAFGQSALTFIGAGTNISNRAIYFYAEGGTTFNGSVDITGTPAQSLSLEVNGRTNLVNGPLSAVALEVTGAVKVSGASPAAFIVTANNANMVDNFFVPSTTNCEFIRINHPHSNANPNALIFLTHRGGFSIPSHVFYRPADGYWYIGISSQSRVRISGSNRVYTRLACDGGCYDFLAVVAGGINYYEENISSWNVLIIQQ